MRITSEEVRHLASLARLGMTAEEIDSMRDSMSDILDSIDVLSRVDTVGIDPTGHVIDVVSVMRDDLEKESMPIGKVLENAPLSQEIFIRVMSVLD